jgi:hypothetical protein
MVLGERVFETTLWQAPVQRHLAAFETQKGHAAPRFLTLMASTGGLALTRAHPATEPLAGFTGAGAIVDFV